MVDAQCPGPATDSVGVEKNDDVLILSLSFLLYFLADVSIKRNFPSFTILLFGGIVCTRWMKAYFFPFICYFQDKTWFPSIFQCL